LNPKAIYIIGGGAQAGKAVALCALLGIRVIGLFCNEDKGSTRHGVEVLGKVDDLKAVLQSNNLPVHVAIGEPFVRKAVVDVLLEIEDIHFQTLIHPSAYIAANAHLEQGCYIGAMAVLENAATIGRHCIIDSGAIVEHDCQLANFINVSPRAALAGGVSVGECSFIGLSASIIQNTNIGHDALIGAGAVVLQSIPDFAVAMGVPARVVRFRDAQERILGSN